MTPADLLGRLDALGAHLATRPDTIALLGLGSAGIETDRLDEHSDLDFFVIVADGAKPAYLESIDWLEAPCPVAFSFINTGDGRKALYRDGIFVEYAVLTRDELKRIPYERSRVIWQRPGTVLPSGHPAARVQLDTVDFHVNEALTNLFVGLHRDLRGERLTASRFIQQYAVDRVLSIVKLTDPDWHGDGFDLTRRVEQRYPDLPLAEMMPGYGGNADAARAVYAWLEARFDVDPVIATAVRDLLATPADR